MKSKHWHIILATILFATLLWASVSMTYEYTTSVSLPVQLKNLPAQSALKKTLPKSVTMKLRGTGWHLLKYTITSEKIFLIDASYFSKSSIVYTDYFISDYFLLPTEITLMDSSPDSIAIEIDISSEKKVKVITDVDVEFSDGYGQIGVANILPDSVVIKGAKSILDTLNEWTTEKKKFVETSKPLNTTLKLTEPLQYILSLEQSEINYSINVQPFAEKTFPGINIEIRLLPPNREVILIPPKLDVIIRGSIDMLADFSSENLKAYIDYQYLLADSTGYIQPEISIPDGLKIVRKQPDQFQYIIRKRLQ
ncbi:MAG: hypothetical protein Q8K98_11730 [Bacteroidota bacterium]|nr:hypothetical protein [Bacteroidota bacterium]